MKKRMICGDGVLWLKFQRFFSSHLFLFLFFGWLVFYFCFSLGGFWWGEGGWVG